MRDSKQKSRDISLALSFDDVILKPQRSTINSRSEIDLTTRISPTLELKIPLIATNMDSVTGVEMAVKMSELGGLAIIPRFESIESQANKVSAVAEKATIVAASIGIKEGTVRAEALVNAGAKVLNIDVAHGHMEQNLQFTKTIKNKFGKEVTVISGIAATGECAQDLYKSGADCVFLGIGGGSICTTRKQTGCGLPTMESILRISRVARKENKTFIPGAGIRNSGDIVKSLAGGASAIAAGSLFAGTKEAPGEIIEIGGKKYKRYNGSTSKFEKDKHLSKIPEGKNSAYTIHIEGVEALIEYKGPVENTVLDLLAGVRSGLSYCGARSINELWQKAEFLQVTPGGLREGGAHDVIQWDQRAVDNPIN